MKKLFLLLSLISGLNAYSIDYKQEMLNLMKEAREATGDGLVIGNGGIEIYFDDETVNKEKLALVDGVLVESLYYGGTGGYGDKTDEEESRYSEGLAKKISEAGRKVLLLEYTDKKEHLVDAKALAKENNFLVHFARTRELDKLPLGYSNIKSRDNDIHKVKDFGIILNPKNYDEKKKYVKDLSVNPNDLLIVDRAFGGIELLEKEDIKEIKKNGKKLIAYISLAEAENYRDYWEFIWNRRRPEWIESENPSWSGNFRVKYWQPEWKEIVMKQIKDSMEKGFDGVFLDVIDTYYYFQEKEK